MANNYQQFSEVINNITPEEEEWLREACDPESALSKKLYELTDTEACDQDMFPDVGWSIRGDHEVAATPSSETAAVSLLLGLPVDPADLSPQPPPSRPTPSTKYLWLYSEEGSNLDHVGVLVQAFLAKFRPKACFSLTYAEYCDKLRVGEFGGGAMFVTAEEVKYSHVAKWVGQQIEAFEGKK